MAVEGLTYSQYLYSIQNEKALETFLNLERAVENGQISPTRFAETVESLTGYSVTPQRAFNGDILTYTLNNKPSVTTTNSLNSNVSTVARSNVAMPVSTDINTVTGNATASRLAGVGTKLASGAALVGTAAMAVATGITLGKTFDGALYNAFPDFFDSNGMSTLNPETWESITAGDDSLGASLLNVLFGFDSNGNGQAYIDENAFAYFASYMQTQGAFNTGSKQVIPSSLNFYEPLYIDNYFGIRPFTYAGDTYYLSNKPICYNPSNNSYCYLAFNNINDECVLSISRNVQNYYNLLISSKNTNPSYCFFIDENTGTYVSYSTLPTPLIYTYDDKISYYQYLSLRAYGTGIIPTQEISNNQNVYSNNEMGPASWNMIYGTITGGEGVEGIGTQQGAITPQNLTGNINDDLTLLQQQYPYLWQNAIDYPVIQPDGTVKNYTYLPVSLPENFTRTQTQPVSGNATQANSEIKQDTATEELINTLTQLLTNPYPKTQEELNNDLPPENPTDTGDGSSPDVIAPTGSASSLWKIYHPTQAQIDSFGSWLWSSDFIDQILKIFNDPMQAIIGLHKVYCTPIDAGNATIKVGYLDSQVPSAYIEQQYITVDCGSVDLYEQFGNVFDYDGYTDINLYLPFIGIVQLNVSDIMRSTINIKYGVDVLTGACLAMVNVSRDGNDAVIYQYSGNCAVQYPISSGSYMGIVSSIIGVAGSVAATIATGGGAAPLAIGAAGAAMNAHTNVQHSGSFSGNAGAMGGKIPYLIISRPQTKMYSEYLEMEGTPTNHYTTVGECSGYIRAKTAHIINVNATDKELDEIQSLLLNGIII